MYSLNFGTKKIISILCISLLGCSPKESFTITENVGENDSLSISNIITWNDTPFWVDSIEHYSQLKLDSIDTEKLRINGINWNEFVGLLSKSNQIDGVDLMIGDENSIEYEMMTSNFKIIYNSDTMSNWRIEKFKEEFPNSYNWRNIHRDGYESKLNFKIDSVHDAIAFKTGMMDKIIIHLVNGKARTLRIVLEKKP
ncbi:MAG: hypothetical protein MUE75_12235 [Algoriphagus sp.]|jgi:hypothetical protein|nr:hypothetical protein [Algoriphagus sp.]